jgi:hypothetical protein
MMANPTNASFICHPIGGQLAKVIVIQRQQFLGRFRITGNQWR